MNQIVKPLLKWAGGKRWMTAKYYNFFPMTFNRFIEPFAGSAAVFFHLRPNRAVLADTNAELIEMYHELKVNWEQVWDLMLYYHKKHSKTFYYEIRDKKPRNSANKAAKFIYLNRTCFNGLYRVNLRGQFNVPIGTKTNVIVDSDDFGKISDALQCAELYAQDFEDTLDVCGKGDLIYADPPYTVKHNSNNFLKYNEKIFSWDDQVRLKNALFNARDRGASIILSNADNEHIRSLYKNFGVVYQVNRSSLIAAESSKRRKTTELIFCSTYLEK